MKSLYEILEVAPSATTAELHSAYLKLAREYHPDRVPEHLTKLRADAEEKLKQVNEAWAVLSDEEKRGKYDALLRNNRPISDGDGRGAAAPARVQQSARRIRCNEFLRRRDLLQWALIVAVVALALVVIGELLIIRQGPTESATQPISTHHDNATSQREPAADARVLHYENQFRHIQTWAAGGGNGLSVQLVTLTLASNETQLVFRVRAVAHNDLLLYEPPKGSVSTRTILGKQVVVDRGFQELRLVDNHGAKYYSTTGFEGGRQVTFNLYNFTRRISFSPQEEVMLSASFPPVSNDAESLTFVSPAVGAWQPEWRWPDIKLK